MQYKDKTELIEEIKKRYTLYDKEFDGINENQKYFKVKVELSEIH